MAGRQTIQFGLLVSAGVLAGAVPAAAQEARANSQLDEITVSAERAPSPVYNSPGTISVTTDEDIDREQIKNPRDLARNEPGVSVGNQPSRTGGTNFTIRGIGENRVRLQIDGIKVPDFPASNAGAGTYTRDFVDFDSLKRIEIIRGPASALYGSDSIGGVVSFITKDPVDYLTTVGKDWYLGAKSGFDTSDNSFSTTTTGAFRSGPWEGMLLFTRRDGQETQINSYRTPNPQTYFVNNGLAKLIYDTPDAGRWKFTAEGLWKGVDTNILTELSPSVFSSRGHDNTRRSRIGLDWTKQLGLPIADEVKTSIYWTDLHRQEVSRQYRGAGGAINAYRFSDFDFLQSIYGAEVQANKRFTTGDWQHQLVYGVTADLTESSRPRDRYQTNLLTGTTSSSVAGDNFPNKNFPDTQTVQAAAYLQDVAQWGRLRLIPALRLDYYQLEPQPDADFARGNASNFTVNSQTEWALSPKLGLTYDLTDELRLFGQYARGFRAPPYDNANFAFSNPLQFYEILPNGNLKPETSDSLEAGLRGRFNDGSSMQFSGYYNRYRDFIDTVVVGTSPAGLTQFQYQNLSRVTIYGAEARGEWRITPEWSLNGALAYAHGEDEVTKRPIDSVDPLTAVAGLRYTSATGWSLEGRVKAVADKDRVSNSATIYRPGGYATVDILGHYDINKHFTLNAAVFNLFDKRYFNAVDVAGVTRTNPNLELFRATGRSFAVNMTARF